MKFQISYEIYSLLRQFQYLKLFPVEFISTLHVKNLPATIAKLLEFHVKHCSTLG